MLIVWPFSCLALWLAFHQIRPYPPHPPTSSLLKMFLMNPVACFLNYVDLLRDAVGSQVLRVCGLECEGTEGSMNSPRFKSPEPSESMRGNERHKTQKDLLLFIADRSWHDLALCVQFLKKSWQTQRGQRGIWVKGGFGVKAPWGFNPYPLFLNLVSLTLRLFWATWTFNWGDVEGFK